MSYLVFLRARNNRDRAAFIAWLRDEHGPFLAASFPGLQRCVVNARAQPPSGPAGLQLPPEMQQDGHNSAPWPGYDGAVLLEGYGAEEAVDLLKSEACSWTDLCHVYRVHEKVCFDKGTIASGAPSSGIMYFRGLIFHDDLPYSAVDRSWTLHAPLAEKVHVGAGRYVQWRVQTQLSADAPAIGGVVELHFPSEKDLTERFFDSKRGRDEIIQDSGHFIAGGPPRLFAYQYVFVGQR